MRWNKLSTAEKGAVVGGIFVLIAALITAIAQIQSSRPKGMVVSDSHGVTVEVELFTSEQLAHNDQLVLKSEADLEEIFPGWKRTSTMYDNDDLPVIDIKFANNTNATILITKATVIVDESLLDPWPVIRIWVPQDGTVLSLVNLGWGEIRESVVEYNIVPSGNAYKLDLPYLKVVGPFHEEATFDIDGELKNQGIDLDERGNAPERKILGLYEDGWATVYGKVLFVGQNYRKEWVQGEEWFARKMFIGLRQLRNYNPGTMMVVSEIYKADLVTEGKDYSIGIPLDLALKSGDFDRIQIELKAPKSSFHRLSVALMLSTGEVVRSRAMEPHVVVLK